MLAEATDGYAGADIKALAGSAALTAVRRSFPGLLRGEEKLRLPIRRGGAGAAPAKENEAPHPLRVPLAPAMRDCGRNEHKPKNPRAECARA